MIRLFKSTAAAIWSAALALVIVAGVISAGAHLAAPLLAGFRGDAERWLESTLRAPVRIERLAVRWRAWGPELVARNVAVLDLAGHATLEVGELTMTVALADLLNEWRLWPARVGIDGVRLKLLRRADGSLGIEGVRSFEADLPEAEDRPGTGGAALLVLLPKRLRISDAEVTVEDRMRGRPPVTFRNASLQIDNDGRRHRVRAALELPDGRGTPLVLAGDLSGDPDRLDDWTADLYLDSRGAQLARLLADVMPPQYRLTAAEADLRVWSRWQRGEPVWIEGRATLRNTELGGVESGQGLRLDAATARFRWDRREDGWLLRVTDFVFDRPDRSPLPSDWALAWRRGGSGREPGWRIVADRLRMEDLAALLAIRPPGGEPVAELLAADPRGVLGELDVQAVRRPTGDWWWSAAGSLANGRLTATGDLPGIDRLGLEFAVGADGGQAALTAAGAQLSLPALFPEALPIGSLRSELRWRPLHGGGWVVEVPAFALANADLSTDGRLRLELPGVGGPRIDLRLGFGGVPATRALAYLPRRAMNTDLVTWLDMAVQGGLITTGICRLRGPLEDFPFEERPTGEFEVRLEIQAADLDYAPGWPRLREIDGEVLVRGYDVDIFVDRAWIYDSRVLETHARIDGAPRAPLEVRGSTAGPLEDPLRLLRESPLSLDFGTIASHLEGSGEVRLDLDFAMPIDDGPAKERLEGALRLADNELALVGRPLRATALRGSLGFDLDGLRARDITGRLFDAPTTVEVQTDAAGVTRVTAALRDLDPRALRELTGDALAPVRGAAAATVTLDVPPLRSPASLLVRAESDLRGIAIDLPDPLGKPAEAGRRSSLELAIPPQGPLSLRARLGDGADLAARLDGDSGRPLRGTLALGGDRAELPTTDGFALRGRLAEVDVPAWVAWAGKRPAAASTERPARPAVTVDLTADHVLLGTGALSDARLRARETPAAWEGEIQAGELAGSFRYPLRLDSDPATLTLDRLAVRSDPGDGPAAAPDEPGDDADPRQMPGLVIEIRQFEINGRDFGQARATAQRAEKGLQLRDLSVDGPAGRLEGGGTWLMTDSGARTSVNFAIDTPSLGKLIESLGFTNTIDDGAAKLNGELSWPGTPLALRRQEVSGRIDLAMTEGRFLEVDPGIGRVIGLLNIAALQRRLTLDFSDLFQKGLGFDTVTGHFDLLAGVVETDDLTIRGPSGMIEILGRTDVIAQEFDQQVTVTPSLRSALPIAGAVVGGPVGGAAMLLMQGLIGRQVDRLGAVRYAVKGPWSDPAITKLAGRTLREQVQGTATTSGAAAAPAGAAEQAPAPVGEPRDAASAPPETAPKPRTLPVPAFH